MQEDTYFVTVTGGPFERKAGFSQRITIDLAYLRKMAMVDNAKQRQDLIDKHIGDELATVVGPLTDYLTKK